jgi:hypothetical protein
MLWLSTLPMQPLRNGISLNRVAELLPGGMCLYMVGDTTVAGNCHFRMDEVLCTCLDSSTNVLAIESLQESLYSSFDFRSPTLLP